MDSITETTPLCPACKIPGTGKLCAACGETLYHKRITLTQLLKHIPDVFDLDHGLIYTIRSFLTRPGKEIHEYFAGDRSKHYKPLKFILFIGGIVTLLMINFKIGNGSEPTAFEKFETQWNSAILIFQFPVIALCTWLIFRKRKYNYGEHLVANAFLIGEVIMFHIVFFPVYLLLNNSIGINIIYFFYLLWILSYYTYAFYDWFYNKQTAVGFFKSMGITIFIFIVTLIVSIPLEIMLYYITVKMGL